MVTYTQMRLIPPLDWNEFEDISKSAFSQRWSNPNLNRHGRQGQKQDGVDIYGYDHFNNFVGVQCKNTIGQITEKIITDECAKAENFIPKLTALYIATTASRDVSIQKFARELSNDRKSQGKFPVEIVFWEDIRADLTKDESVVRQHYPQLFGSDIPSDQDLMKKKDIDNLKLLLKDIDLPFVRNSFQYGAKYIDYQLFDQLDIIKSFKLHYPYAFYNSAIDQAINSLVQSWEKLVNLIKIAPYEDGTPFNRIRFQMRGDICKNQNQADLYEKINDEIDVFIEEMKKFTLFIKSNYVQVNFN